MTDKQELRAALEITLAVSETIREAGSTGVAAGPLYAMLMDSVTLAGFEKLIATLVNARLIERRASHLLVWCGPEIAA